MQTCNACGKTGQPTLDLDPQLGVRPMCSNPECKALMPSVTPDVLSVSKAEGDDKGTLTRIAGGTVVEQDSLRPEGPNPLQSPQRAPVQRRASGDPVADAKAQLAEIDAELARLGGLQRQRRRLAAMVAAAELADEEDKIAAE